MLSEFATKLAERPTVDPDRSSDGFQSRVELLAMLARQGRIRALCFNEAITRCPVPAEVVALGFDPLEPTPDSPAAISMIEEHDRAVAIATVIKARNRGAACTSVETSEGSSLIVHAFDMLPEWGVIVVAIGGEIRPLLAGGMAPAAPLPPRRCVHHRDRTGQMLYVDAASEQLLGWTSEQMIGLSALEFVDKADHERGIQGWIEMLVGGHAERSRLRYITATGERRWLEVTLTNMLDELGFVEVELIDVHDEMVALSAAKWGQAQFGALTESLPVGVIQVDARGEVIYANAWIRDLITDPERKGPAKHVLAEEDRPAIRAAVMRALAGASVDIDAHLTRGSDGAARLCRFRIRALEPDDDGTPRGAIASVEDMTETIELHDRLRMQIRTDHLTGLPNRLALSEWLHDTLHSTTAVEGATGAGATVLYLDLDGFKWVNDRHGHDAGDRVLQAVATRVRAVLAPTDLFARVGGDEFVIARAGSHDRPAAEELVTRVLATFDHEITIEDVTVKLGCSIGIARAYSDDSASVVLDAADRAMYQAKREGGQRWSAECDLPERRQGERRVQPAVS